MRRPLSLIALVADLVVAVAVFLPWAGVSGGTASVAGWGSAVTPRLTGLFVLAAAATALSLRGGALLVDAADRALPQVGGATLDGVNILLALTVVTGAAAFVGTSETSGPRLGAWLALLGATVGLVAGITALALGTDTAPAERAADRIAGFGGPTRPT